LTAAFDKSRVVTGTFARGVLFSPSLLKKVCGERRVLDIIGGFHLLNPSPEQLQETVNYIERLKPTALHPCHCTDWDSKLALSRVAALKEVGVGLKLEY
jgi:7,8-dihydropterin-6-yl-methyl-4-(beta-D-ribofuranosyl)aminobenzene 5'-phosphate synthase